MVKLNLNSAYIRLLMIKEDCSLLDYILDFMLVQQTLLQIRIKSVNSYIVNSYIVKCNVKSKYRYFSLYKT